MNELCLDTFSIGTGHPLAIIAGPCVIEEEGLTLSIAEHLKKITERHRCSLIFKASYDKANRSSKDSFRGPGMQEGLRILERVKREYAVPVLTDIHSPEEAHTAASVCDFLQIPAFLCRQTDLVLAAAQTHAAINVKKGQFLSPWEMKNIVDKILSCGNERILLTDRGTSFGYNNLVSDFRAIPIMQGFGFPVCFDATHSVQLPGGLGASSGGQREFVPVLARAAVAAGCNALFFECHPDPPRAKSDSATVLPFETVEALLSLVEKIYDALK